MSVGQTALQSAISIVCMLVSLPLGFLVLAPRNLHGFDLGGFGLALKMLLVSLVAVNYLNYAIAKRNGFKIGFWDQLVIPVFLGIGFLSKYLVSKLVIFESHAPISFIIAVLLTTSLYLLLIYFVCLRFWRGRFALFFKGSSGIINGPRG